ncbi:MAG: hypothetical protein D6737_12545 [Chloroflexi bacterium]|nr:MAG: hypothetical protein CUN54_06855 [Phototrophicales bacterium]RMF79116.1 MAG: hypothetical protein D6737_12545 [Chloroflexota bacterium]
MQFTREIHRIVIGLLIAFSIIALQAGYLAVFGPNTIGQRQDNARLFEAEAAIRRGAIIDRNGTVLVTTTANEDESLSRNYLQPAMNSALGYFSLRFGVGGAEAAFDDILRGDDVPKDFVTELTNQLLHRPQQGADIRLTLDLDLQQRIVAAMEGHTGAVVVISVPDGETLAMVSLPTFNPNTLDDEWDTLRESPDNPFFNRVLQANYQPGGMMETLLVAAAIRENNDLGFIYPDAIVPISIPEATLTCAERPPENSLTLMQAYRFACPAVFAQVADEIGQDMFSEMLDNFHFNEPAMLSGFVFEEDSVDNATTTAESQATLQNFDLNVLGQGDITIAPMRMVTIAAAILNDGNAPQPFALLEVRRPDSDIWQPAKPIQTTIAMTTADTARQLQTFMREAVSSGAAQAAAHNDLDIGGHAALAHSGEGTQAWFIGFVATGNTQGAAVAVVLENNDSAAEAARIGGIALEAAANIAQPIQE